MGARLRLHRWRTFGVGGLPCPGIGPEPFARVAQEKKMFNSAPESLIRCRTLTRISHLLRIQYSWQNV